MQYIDKKVGLICFVFFPMIIPPVSAILKFVYRSVKKYLKTEIQATKKMITTIKNLTIGLNQQQARDLFYLKANRLCHS